MNQIQDTIIYWPSVRIIADVSEEDTNELLVHLNELNWNEAEEGYAYLTLAEIASQLQGIGHATPYYVWFESGLSGTIYQYGNYDPKEWIIHGTTKGYA